MLTMTPRRSVPEEGELRGPGGSGGGAGGAGGAAGVLASPLLCAQKHSAALADVVALS